MKARLLVVDDDQFMRTSLEDTIRSLGHHCEVFESPLDALGRLSGRPIDLVITDLKMPKMNGLEFLAKVHEKLPDLPVIVITAHGTIETAVEAMKCGALDYIRKPFGANELELVIGRALAHRGLSSDQTALEAALRGTNGDRPLLGESPPMLALRERIARIAPSDATVLIRGETGTGKEVVARAIHRASSRRDRPYLCVNCAALSAGLLESELFGHEKGAFTGADRQRTGRFELADGGTLLLDEVSEIEPSLQAKLLRVLQEREFERVGSSKTLTADVRVLATTNRKLEDEVHAGRFRQDLYFRLNIVPVEVPPLRDRIDDVPLLADTFKERSESKSGFEPRPFSKAAVKKLTAHHWPGNVRELENLIERAVLLSTGPEIELEDLGAGDTAPPATTDFRSLRGMPLKTVERALIEETLRQFGGHQQRSADSLGIGVRTLRDKIKKWNIRIEEPQT